MTMLAAMFYAPLDVRMEQRPIPQPGIGEVLLKVAAATTCGTDVKTYLRGHPLLIRSTPSGFGHEAAGFVAARGLGVTQCVEGDAIVIANSAPCQQCFYCRRGNFSICEDLHFLNGAYAEYILVPERIVRMNLYRLAPDSSFIASALTEPLACALHGVDACKITQGDTVVIRKGDVANNGDIIVALVDDEEATLKRLRRKGVSVALEAANPAYETRIFGPDRVKVQGRLVGLLRKY